MLVYSQNECIAQLNAEISNVANYFDIDSLLKNSITQVSDYTCKKTSHFSPQLIRPSFPAYIRLLDSENNMIDAVDTSNEYQVHFSGNELHFSMYAPPLPPGIHPFKLKVDPGVAIKEGATNPDCGLYSSSAEWDVFLQGKFG